MTPATNRHYSHWREFYLLWMDGGNLIRIQGPADQIRNALRVFKLKFLLLTLIRTVAALLGFFASIALGFYFPGIAGAMVGILLALFIGANNAFTALDNHRIYQRLKSFDPEKQRVRSHETGPEVGVWSPL